MAISKIAPAGILIGTGIFHVLLALSFNLPIPLQPMKAIATIALSERWNFSKISGTGFSVGLILMILSFSDKINKSLEKIPGTVVKGIILALALKLFYNSFTMIETNLLLSILLIFISFILITKKIFPSSIFLLSFGIFYAIFFNGLNLSTLKYGLPPIIFNLFSFEDVFSGLIKAGFTQIILTLTNAVIATLSLSRLFFPNQEKLTSKKLLFNMGLINLTIPFIGGIPLCHGSGGLSSHYVFGARTGGSILMLGAIELGLGLFFSSSIKTIISFYPFFVIGVMLFFSSLQLVKSSFKQIEKNQVFILMLTTIFSLFFNFVIGLILGVLSHVLLKDVTIDRN